MWRKCTLLYSSRHWASHVLQGIVHTRPCLFGHPVATYSLKYFCLIYIKKINILTGCELKGGHRSKHPRSSVRQVHAAEPGIRIQQLESFSLHYKEIDDIYYYYN